MGGLVSDIGGALGSVGSIMGLGGAGGSSSAAKGAANATDPMQQYRSYFAKQLYQLYSDPNQFLASNPVYQAEKQAGMNAVQGSAAAQGMLNSGSTLSALQTQGSNLAAENIWGNIGTLANLASPNPGTQSAYQYAGQQQNKQNAINLNDLGQAAGWLGDLWSAFSYK